MTGDKNRKIELIVSMKLFKAEGMNETRFKKKLIIALGISYLGTLGLRTRVMGKLCMRWTGRVGAASAVLWTVVVHLCSNPHL